MPATVSCTRSPKPYCFSVMMKKPASRSCTTLLRAEAQRGAEHRGRRDQRSDRNREDVGDLHRDHDEQQRDRHPGDHRRDRLTVLGALGADQLVALLVFGVDAPDDSVGPPS